VTESRAAAAGRPPAARACQPLESESHSKLESFIMMARNLDGNRGPSWRLAGPGAGPDGGPERHQSVVTHWDFESCATFAAGIFAAKCPVKFCPTMRQPI
jgi:hypothetical protein